MSQEKDAPRPIAAPEGTWPLDEWPLDVQRTDESGNVDLEQIEYNLTLTPAQRVEQHYQARLFAERLRRAGERLYGPIISNLEAAE